MSTIILGVTGSIAAYKAAEIASHFAKKGDDVYCVLTQSAKEFITPLTLSTLSRNPCLTSLAEEANHWQPDHIHLADKADIFIVCPATANTIGHLANGLAPDSLSSIYLATKAQTLIAPAMNGKMWNHPATKRNVVQLKKDGCTILGPDDSGILACGYEGAGRLMPIPSIIEAIQKIII